MYVIFTQSALTITPLSNWYLVGVLDTRPQVWAEDSDDHLFFSFVHKYAGVLEARLIQEHDMSSGSKMSDGLKYYLNRNDC